MGSGTGIDPNGQFMKFLISLITIMSLFTSCKNGGNPAQAAEAVYFDKAEKLLNVPYGPDSLQRMDIYLRAGRSAQTTKSFVLFLGCCLIAGS